MDFLHLNDTRDLHFYKMGVAEENSEQFLTLGEMFRRSGHMDRKINYLKVCL